MQAGMEPVGPFEESTLMGEDDVFDLVEELQGSTLMRTRNRYKSSTSMFLLHLYQRSHPALNPVFAQKMKESLEKPRTHKRATDASLLYTLLPGYCDAKPLEPLIWEKVTPEVILAPIANMRRGDSKSSDSKINAYRSALHLLFKDFEKTDLWRAMSPVVRTIINGWEKNRKEEKRG